jgi:hypothetical protein
MIAPSDDDYRQTKRLKISGARLPSPFLELADWINAHYGVSVLNPVLHTIDPNDLARLNVIFESTEEKRQFLDMNGINFDASKQAEIRDEFKSVANDITSHRYDLARLLLIFSAFEPVARTEANWLIADSAIQQLKDSLNDRNLWEIRRGFECATFLLHTDSQVKAYEAAGTRDRFMQAWAKLAAPHDKFGYLARRPLSVLLDSKETFDTVYKSNWFYYDKDH